MWHKKSYKNLLVVNHPYPSFLYIGGELMTFLYDFSAIIPGLSPDHSRQPKDFQPDPHPLKGRTFPLRRGREDVPSGNQSRARAGRG